MINVKEYLLKNNIKYGTYALVTYNNEREPIWFTRYNFDGNDWFLEAPCQLYKMMEITEPIDDFCKKYIKECICLNPNTNEEEYIDKHLKSNIVDGVLYQIENFQCSPYLPEEVNDIKLLTERECLEYLLQEKIANKLQYKGVKK